MDDEDAMLQAAILLSLQEDEDLNEDDAEDEDLNEDDAEDEDLNEDDPDLLAALHLWMEEAGGGLTDNGAADSAPKVTLDVNEDSKAQETVRLSVYKSEQESFMNDLDLTLALQLQSSEVKSCLASRSTALTNLEPYKYEPLQSPRDIRVLRVMALPGETDLDLPTLECSLLVASIGDPMLPKYTTLSYAWSETFQDGSHLNAHLLVGNKLLAITQDLALALRSIAYTRYASIYGELDLWVDSICINQADSEERNSQVAHMAEIYAKSQDMIIWLGQQSSSAVNWKKEFHTVLPSESPIDALAVSFLPMEKKAILERLLRNPPIEFSRSNYLSTLKGLARPPVGNSDAQASEGQRRTERNLHSFSSSIDWYKGHEYRQSYIELTQRPWFHSKWVVQEVAHTTGKPRDFLISTRRLPFAHLASEISKYSLEDTIIPLNSIPSNRTLLQNLSLYRNTQCSDPHDHIYSLLGLSSDFSWLAIDYTQNVHELYTNVAGHYVTKCHHVAILALATAHKSSKDLPSWVPDWRETWKFDRSTRHADAMTTLSRGDRKLWQSRDIDADNVGLFRFGSRMAVNIRAWVVPQCISADGHDNNTCRKCQLTRDLDAIPSTNIASNASPAAGISKRKGKQSQRVEQTEASSSSSLLSMRQTAVREKWSRIIQEQFQVAIDQDEVLCFLNGSALAFVLRPAGESQDLSKTSTYTLQFCFQVDEEGWMSDWFARILGLDSQEQVYIV